MSLWYLADMSKADYCFAGMLQIQPTALELAGAREMCSTASAAVKNLLGFFIPRRC